MLSIKCDGGLGYNTKITDKDGRDLTAAMAVESVSLSVDAQSEWKAEFRLAGLQRLDITALRAQWLLRNPVSGIWTPVQRIEWADGVVTEFNERGAVDILPASAAA